MNIYDYDSDDFIYPISEDMALDSDANLYIKLDEDLVEDFERGGFHMISPWPDEDDGTDDTIKESLPEKYEEDSQTYFFDDLLMDADNDDIFLI